MVLAPNSNPTMCGVRKCSILFSFVVPVPNETLALCSWLTEVEPNMVVWGCSQSALKFDVFDAHHNRTEWLSELL